MPNKKMDVNSQVNKIIKGEIKKNQLKKYKNKLE
jgi:hypothetical protein